MRVETVSQCKQVVSGKPWHFPIGARACMPTGWTIASIKKDPLRTLMPPSNRVSFLPRYGKTEPHSSEVSAPLSLNMMVMVLSHSPAEAASHPHPKRQPRRAISAACSSLTPRLRPPSPFSRPNRESLTLISNSSTTLPWSLNSWTISPMESSAIMRSAR